MFTELHGREPLHPGELSGFVAQQSRPDSSAVAGFDLTFSPVKSVSTLWAVAPREVSEQIEAAHDAAVTRTLEFLQTEAGYTRVGAHGVAQVDIRGLVAARFTHRDSRAGDPDLHTHVAISNKVQTLDGRWLALDARMLYRMTVAASEFYNTQLEAEVTTRVGGTFTERATRDGKRPVRELVGVDERLNTRWSSRRRAIDTVTADLSARFVTDHGRVPTTVESLRLAQQATLATRDRKHEPRSLAEQRTEWRRQALEVLGGKRNLDLMVAAATTRHARQRPRWTGKLLGELDRRHHPHPGAVPGAVAGEPCAGRGDPADPGRRGRPGPGERRRRPGHHPGAHRRGVCPGGGGHRTHRPRRAGGAGGVAPHGRDVGVPGREGAAVHHPGGAGRGAADRHRRRPDRRETRHRRAMSRWRCWNGRPTPAAGP